MLKRIDLAIIILLCSAITFSQLVFCQGAEQRIRKMTVAVINFEAIEGVTSGEARSLSDIFSAQLMKSREFTVVDRNSIQAILMEQGFQQSEACSNVECVSEMGKILKAEQIVSGRIGKVGRVFNITVQAINVNSAQIIFTSNKAYVGEIEGLLLDVVPQIAADMVLEMTGKKIEAGVSLESPKEPLSVGFCLGYISISGSSGSGSNIQILTANLGELLRNVTFNPEISTTMPNTSFGLLSLNLNIVFHVSTGTAFIPYFGIGVGSYHFNPFSGSDGVDKTQKFGTTGLCAFRYQFEKSRLALVTQVRYTNVSPYSFTGIIAGLNYSLE